MLNEKRREGQLQIFLRLHLRLHCCHGLRHRPPIPTRAERRPGVLSLLSLQLLLLASLLPVHRLLTLSWSLALLLLLLLLLLLSLLLMLLLLGVLRQ